MTYTFVDISTTKFSINGRELFKTFIPFFVNDSSIRIISVYDRQTILVPTSDVVDFVVNGSTYGNATDLSNAIHTVIYSKTVGGSINNAQIEANRLAIIDLQNNKADVNHNHDSRYYTQTQVDQLIANIVNNSGSDVVKGEVDGDDINFLRTDDTVVFSIDAKTFTAQGTSLSFSNGVLTLKNDKGVVLSTTNISAKESYYDTFNYVEGYEDDLTDLILTNPFEVVQTVGDLYFFVSDALNVENFVGTRLFINDLDAFFDLDTPDIITTDFNAWQLSLSSPNLIVGNDYRFDFWIKDALSTGGYTGTAQDLKDEIDSILPTSRIVSGGIQWVSGLTYESVNLSYEINSILFTITDGTTVTLNAAPTTGTDKRIDLIYGDDTGSLGVKEGVEANPPITPNLDDPLTQLQLHLALLDTNATQPTGVSKILAYAENLGQPTEYDATSNAATIDVDSSVNPITGSKSISVVNAAPGNSGTGDSFTLQSLSEITINEFANINFDIRTDVVFPSGIQLGISLINSNTANKIGVTYLNLYRQNNNVGDVINLSALKNSFYLIGSSYDEFDTIEFRVYSGFSQSIRLSCTIDNIFIHEDENAPTLTKILAKDVGVEGGYTKALSGIKNVEEALARVDEYLKSEPIKLVLSLPNEDIIAPTTFAAYNVMNWNGRITDLVLECDPHNRPTGSTIIVDVLKNGTSILFTPITIDIGGYFSLHAAVQPVIADDSFIIGDIISADILQEGSTDPGQWLQLAILTEKS